MREGPSTPRRSRPTFPRVTRFYDVKLREAHPSTDIYPESCVELPGLLRKILVAARCAGARGLAKGRLFPAVRAHFEAIGGPAALQTTYEVVLARDKRLLSRVLQALAADPADPTRELGELSVDQAHALWLAQNLVHAALPGAVTPIVRTEALLELRARVLPEGAIPSMARDAARMRQFASRILRDKDSPHNLWVKTFGLDAMARRTWWGAGIDHACMEKRTKVSGELRVVAEERWLRHLVPGELFQSAG